MTALKNSKHETAAQQYLLNGRNKSKAYRTAFNCSHMKPETINNNAYKLFKRQEIRRRVAELEAVLTQIAEREFGIDARYVLNRLVEIDKMDVLDILQNDGRLKPISEWPEIWRKSVTGFDISNNSVEHQCDRHTFAGIKKVKWPDKVKNLELLGKHVEIQAFQKNLSVSGVANKYTFEEDINPHDAVETYHQMIKRG